jgi:FkbM family methyltransferase
MDEALMMLRQRGYAPRVVIDAGANMGQWTEVASRVFGSARFEMIEPQPACHPALRAVAARRPNARLHPVALSQPGRTSVAMTGMADHGSTGAWVVEPDDPRTEDSFPAVTLDELFGRDVVRDDRALLKLDIEGHELAALSGAKHLLANVEVVVTETQFFPIDDNGLPCAADVVSYLTDQGFCLYDVATLNGRGRDMRLVQGDLIFARKDSPLCLDTKWS